MKYRYLVFIAFMFLFGIGGSFALELEDGIYAIGTSLDKNKVLTLKNSKTVLGTFNYDDSQKWKVEKEDDYYKITSVLGDNYSINNTLSLIIRENGNGYNIISSDTGLFADVENLKTSDGTNIIMWQDNGGKNQLFSFFKIDEHQQVIEDGTYVINSLYGSNFSLATSTLDDKGNIYLEETNSSYFQAFNIKYYDGYYRISLFNHDDMFIGINNGNVEVSNEGQWIIRRNIDGTYGLCNDDNYCLDIYGDSKKYGTNVAMYKSHGSANQRFVFQKVSFPVLDGNYTISSFNDDLVIGLDNYVATNEINVYIEKKNNENNQKWYFKNIKDNIYEIESAVDTNYVFDVYKGFKEKGANVEIYKNHSSLNQRWYVMMLSDGTYHITSVNSNKNLDIYGGNIKNGSNIAQWENHYGDNQKFRLIETTVNESKQEINDGKYIISSLVDLDKSIRGNYIYDLEGATTEMVDILYDDGIYILKNNGMSYTNSNGKLVLSKFNDSDSQKWVLRKINDCFVFYSKSDGKVIDIPNSSVTNGTNLLTWKYNGGNNQKFYLEEVDNIFLDSDYYKIKSDNMFLSIDDSNAYNKTKILFKDNLGDDSQKWYFKKIRDNLYEIRYALNRGKAIDVYGNYKTNGTYLITYSFTNGDNQKWYLIKLKNGKYKFISKSSHKALTDDKFVKIYSNNKNKNQSFEIEKTDKPEYTKVLNDGYYNISSNLNMRMMMDVYRADIISGTNVILYQSNNGLNQVWKFKYITDGMYYITSALNPKRYLTNNNGNVEISKNSNSDNQKWYINILDDGSISLISVLDGLHLTTYNGYSSNETNIVMGDMESGFILNDYSDKKTYKGLDISKWQGNIDFKLLVRENPGFIIMRVGRGIRDLGKDVKFDEYYEKATSHDIPVGVYIYSFASNLNEAKEEADYVMTWLGGRSLDLPVFYDMEYSGQLYLGKEVLTKIAEEFCSNIISNNYHCGIYANVYWLTNFIDGEAISKNYPIWLAHWTGANTYSSALLNEYKSGYNLSPYQYWQFTDSGRLSGITENTVDLDFGYDIFD